MVELTGGSPSVTIISLLWLSGIASAIVDNIPYTATMIPLVQDLGQQGIPVVPSWWALAIGADLGGNATIVGASANVIVVSLAARAGHPISFRGFLRYGVPVTLMSLLVATAYLWLRYL
jgi:Na+/H+ antiporter NhaD/arsenite permease-like protein